MGYPRRYNVVAASGLAATALAASLVAAWIGSGAAYVLQASAFFLVLFLTVATLAGAAHPHATFGPANVVTTMRAVAAALAAGWVGRQPAPAAAWAVVGIAAIVWAFDGLDGWLARRARMASPYGARFDMETDAAFILVLSTLVWQYDKAGPWILLGGLMRYGFAAGGWMLPWLAAPLRPTWRGRAVAACQPIGLGVALMPVVPPAVSAPVAAATLAVLAWSFAVDVMRLWRAAPRHAKE
jgi:phosphatidylglycerophosphate synthase